MAWSKRSKHYEEDRSSGAGADWIHSTSIDEALASVRKAWKANGIHAKDGDWPLIQLAHIAVMRGLTGRAAPLVVRLMQKREADGRLRWNLDDGQLGAVGISIVRLMAAYVEDPTVSVSAAREAVALFLRSIADHDALHSVQELMPLILAARTEGVAFDEGATRRAKKLPLRTDMNSSGMCAATHRQWRVEYLLAMGAEEEALDLAHKGRSEKPCGGTCAFAPHSMYAWLLEPLHRRGRHEEARILHDRMESLMTHRTLYLNAMGHRIAWLALEERYDDAGHLLRAMLPLAREPEASPWQRLQFFAGCQRAIEHCESRAHYEALLGDGAVDVHVELQDHLRTLRSAFAQRAG